MSRYVPRHRRDGAADAPDVSPVCSSCGHTTIDTQPDSDTFGSCVNPWCERNRDPED